MKTNDPVAQLRTLLEKDGVHSALRMLNERVPHRYTIIYRFDGDTFIAVAAVDKLKDEMPLLFERVPFEASFCQYTLAHEQFVISDTLKEFALRDHVHRETVRAYVGLPLMLGNGGIWGTFCHLDLAPQDLTDEEFKFLKVAAQNLARYAPRAFPK